MSLGDKTGIENKILKQHLIVLKFKLKVLGGPKNQDTYFTGEIHRKYLRKYRVWLCSARLVLGHELIDFPGDESEL